MKSVLPLLLAALLGLSECKKKNDPSPEEQLPPATQTGANTFGCLVNGQAWTPKGFNGYSNYSVIYDAGLGGVLDVRAYRYFGVGANDYQYIVMFARAVLGPGTYSFSNTTETRVSLEDNSTGCYLNSRDAGTYYKGTLTITRLDLAASIIAGTFDFTLAKPGCDTIRVTNGRFDKKL